MKKGKKKRPEIVRTLLIGTGSMFLALILANTEPFQSLELDLRDYRFRLRGPLELSESPLIILALDDQSDDSTPSRWPWPRSYFARVIDNLNRAGVAAVGVDVIFDQPDRHSDGSDELFAETLQKYSNVVLSGKLEHNVGSYRASSLRAPYYPFIETGNSWGLVSTEVDKDGIFRQYILTHQHMDSTYLSFALELLRIYRKYPALESPENRSGTIVFGQDTIPAINQNAMLINYCGPANTFPTIPFDNVLDDQEFSLATPYDMDAFDDPGDPELGIPPGLLHSGVLRGKIVLIGATMKELQDYFPTPYLETLTETGRIKLLTPGVEIHANALETIISGRYLRELDYWAELLLMLAAALIAGLLCRSLGTMLSGSIILLFVLLYCAAGFLLFVNNGLFIMITLPVTAIAVSYLGNTLDQYMQSQREKRIIQGAFAHYVPEKVVNQIINNPDSLTLGGEDRVVSVLFSDIAGFTTISESLQPSELVALLNEYLTAMCEILLANEGIIDKFEGDAIMAEFGVPIPVSNHADQACTTALGMQSRLAEMREDWKKENRPQLTMRVGINTGNAIVGNMGSRDVFDYTVIGDSVNLGARLEGANKFFGTNILISEYTRELLSAEFIVRKLDRLVVKGKAEPVTVYQLIGDSSHPASPDIKKMIDDYEAGLTCYGGRDFSEAIKKFTDVLENFPEDKPALMMIERCRNFKRTAPPRDWLPVTVLTEK